jgi:hypothetical protein
LRFSGGNPTVSVGLTYSINDESGEKVMVFTAGTGTVTW